MASDEDRIGPPSVKSRGIFLNDEDWGLQEWAEHTYEPEVGDIGPRTYAKIFELLLRLKANHIWPAMHPSTRAFNYYEENKVVADKYAIVMSSSHAEPILRNNVDEWEHDGEGEWNVLTSRENVLRYWEERVAENAQFENVYTVGMRGIHDSGMQGGGSTEEGARSRHLTSCTPAGRSATAACTNPLRVATWGLSNEEWAGLARRAPIAALHHRSRRKAIAALRNLASRRRARGERAAPAEYPFSPLLKALQSRRSRRGASLGPERYRVWRVRSTSWRPCVVSNGAFITVFAFLTSTRR